MGAARVTVLLLALAIVPAFAGCGQDSFRCEVDHDCDGSDLCQVSTGKCLKLADVQCRQDEDCVDPRKGCWDLSCVERCSTANPCADPTRTCLDGLCVPGGQGPSSDV